MLFNTIDYFIFLPIVLIVFRLVPNRWRWVWLLGVSYYFYMQWHAAYALLILLSTVVDYCTARVIGRSENPVVRRTALGVSLATNLGLLTFFKYWGFLGESINAILTRTGVETHIPAFDVLLPVGISFYTFQTMAYTIDVYRRRFEPERHFGMFALYVAYFPQLVAGPIERPASLLPQLKLPSNFNWDRFFSGTQLILWGLFKKVVIADNFAVYVDAVYSNVASHNASSHVLATYAFAAQVYCDFSGYTDIARGTAQLLGVDLMKNFRQPYFAVSIPDFWQRWHISLSTWIRDYLYVSLGGNRKGVRRTYINLMLAMTLAGLWHGAAWTLVVWGALQGVLLCLSRLTMAYRDRVYGALNVPDWLRVTIRRFITFHLVCWGFVIFRSQSLGDAWSIMKGIPGGLGERAFFDPVLVFGAVGLPILLAVQLIQLRHESARTVLAGWTTPVRWTAWYVLIFLIVLLGNQGGTQFIYFQF